MDKEKSSSEKQNFTLDGAALLGSSLFNMPSSSNEASEAAAASNSFAQMMAYQSLLSGFGVGGGQSTGQSSASQQQQQQQQQLAAAAAFGGLGAFGGLPNPSAQWWSLMANDFLMRQAAFAGLSVTPESLLGGYDLLAQQYASAQPDGHREKHKGSSQSGSGGQSQKRSSTQSNRASSKGQSRSGGQQSSYSINSLMDRGSGMDQGTSGSSKNNSLFSAISLLAASAANAAAAENGAGASRDGSPASRSTDHRSPTPASMKSERADSVQSRPSVDGYGQSETEERQPVAAKKRGHDGGPQGEGQPKRSRVRNGGQEKSRERKQKSVGQSNGPLQTSSSSALSGLAYDLGRKFDSASLSALSGGASYVHSSREAEALEKVLELERLKAQIFTHELRQRHKELKTKGKQSPQSMSQLESLFGVTSSKAMTSSSSSRQSHTQSTISSSRTSGGGLTHFNSPFSLPSSSQQLNPLLLPPNLLPNISIYPKNAPSSGGGDSSSPLNLSMKPDSKNGGGGGGGVSRGHINRYAGVDEYAKERALQQLAATQAYKGAKRGPKPKQARSEESGKKSELDLYLERMQRDSDFLKSFNQSPHPQKRGRGSRSHAYDNVITVTEVPANGIAAHRSSQAPNITIIPVPGPVPSGRRTDEGEEFEDDEATDTDTGSIRGSSEEEEEGKKESGAEESAYGAEGRRKRARREVDERELRIPIEHGWRRVVTIESFKSSGIKGEVVYHTPCLKIVKSHQEIAKYLEKNEITDIGKDNFSFSAKVLTSSEFVQKNGEELVPLQSDEVIAQVEEITRRGRRRAPKSRRAEGAEDLSNGDTMEDGTKRKSKRISRLEQHKKTEEQENEKKQEELRLILRAEKERLLAAAREAKKQRVQDMKKKQQEKLDEIRHEKEVRNQQILEARKRRQDELEKQRVEESIRKAKEKEARRQQAMAMKEQELQKRREMLIMVDLERERRRQHMVLIKALEGRKKYEEREKLKEDQRLQKIQEREKRMEQRQLELQIMRELRKPVEDMELTDAEPLTELNRIPGVKLPGQAFADILMVFEFLHNFGETLGFDMQSLPTLNSLQFSLLNNEEAEEELLSILHHLLVCAIEDPGVPPQAKVTTLLGQNMKEVDITPYTTTEVLKLFIRGRNGEQDPMVQKLHKVPFLALNATEKASMLAFVCNELLYNRAINQQIDGNIDQLQNLKKDKWIIENKLRRLRTVHSRKLRLEELRALAKEAEEKQRLQLIKDGAVSDKENEVLAKDVEMDTPVNEPDKRKPGKPCKKKRGRKKKSDIEKELARRDESAEDSEASSYTPGAFGDGDFDEEEDPEMTAEEADRKVEKLVKKDTGCHNQILRKQLQLRGHGFGQDRFKRRYWVLSHAGGVFVEGAESAELEGLESPPEEFKYVKTEYEKIKRESTVELKTDDPETDQSEIPKTEIDDGIAADDEMDGQQTNLNKQLMKKGLLTPDIKLEFDSCVKREGDNDVIKENGGVEYGVREIGVGDLKENGDVAGVDAIKKEDEVTDSLTRSTVIFNGLNMSTDLKPVLSDVTLNAEKLLKDLSEKLAPHPPGKPWFSIMPRKSCDEIGGDTEKVASPASSMTCDDETPVRGRPFLVIPPSLKGAVAASMSDGEDDLPLNPRLLAGIKRESDGVGLELKMPVKQDPRPIPLELQKGWWRITEPETLKTLRNGLHSRGIREKLLAKELERHTDLLTRYCAPSAYSEDVDLEVTEYDSVVAKMVGGAADADQPSTWSHMVALKAELVLLEQIEVLEEKVVSASMQIKGWKLPPRLTDDERVKFRPSSVVHFLGPDDVDHVSERPPPPPLSPPPVKPGRKPKMAAANLNCDAQTEYLLCPMAVTKERLAALEANIERRYIRPPLAHKESCDIFLNSSLHQTPVQSSTPRITATSQAAAAAAASITPGAMEEEGPGQVPPVEEEEEDRAPPSPVREEDLPPGLLKWRNAVLAAKTSAQLAMCLHQLENCISWDKSIMKASCQFCHSGDNEGNLLLCDSCDKGYHTYCFKPKMETIPEGDWYCYECLNKASGCKVCLVCGKRGKNLCICDNCPKAYHIECMMPQLARMPKGKWLCATCQQYKLNRQKSMLLKKRAFTSTPREDRAPPVLISTPVTPLEPEPRRDATPERNPTPAPPGVSAAKQTPKGSGGTATPPNVQTTKDVSVEKAKDKPSKKEWKPCKILTDELALHDEAWPFALPVNTKQFPTYRKIIKRPMDLQTIKNKLLDFEYKNRDEYVADIRLIFDNCETFNEDDSPVGKAGHNLRAYFETRWAQLTGK